VLAEPRVQQLVRHGEHFDLVITEIFDTDCFLALAHRLRAPVLNVCTSAMQPWGHARFGDPSNPAYVPNLFLGFTDEMDVPSRVYNALFLAGQRLLKSWYFDMRDQKVAAQYLGPGLPRVADLATNSSLVLVNTFHALSAKPLAPNVIEVGGIHITRPPRALPQVSPHPQC
jgi:glucuronosyltransferase